MGTFLWEPFIISQRKEGADFYRTLIGLNQMLIFNILSVC